MDVAAKLFKTPKQEIQHHTSNGGEFCPAVSCSVFVISDLISIRIYSVHVTSMWWSIERVSCERCYGEGKVERCLSIFTKTIYKAFTFQPNIFPFSASRFRLHFTYKTSKQFSCGFSCRQESSRARIDREEEGKCYQMKNGGKENTKGSSVHKRLSFLVQNPISPFTNNPAVDSDPWESCSICVVNKASSLWSIISTKHWAENRSPAASRYHIIRTSVERHKEQEKQMITEQNHRGAKCWDEFTERRSLDEAAANVGVRQKEERG